VRKIFGLEIVGRYIGTGFASSEKKISYRNQSETVERKESKDVLSF
jgi:hypothetical protein